MTHLWLSGYSFNTSSTNAILVKYCEYMAERLLYSCWYLLPLLQRPAAERLAWCGAVEKSPALGLRLFRRSHHSLTITVTLLRLRIKHPPVIKHGWKIPPSWRWCSHLKKFKVPFVWGDFHGFPLAIFDLPKGSKVSKRWNFVSLGTLAAPTSADPKSSILLYSTSSWVLLVI